MWCESSRQSTDSKYGMEAHGSRTVSCFLLCVPRGWRPLEVFMTRGPWFHNGIVQPFNLCVECFASLACVCTGRETKTTELIHIRAKALSIAMIQISSQIQLASRHLSFELSSFEWRKHPLAGVWRQSLETRSPWLGFQLDPHIFSIFNHLSQLLWLLVDT